MDSSTYKIITNTFKYMCSCPKMNGAMVEQNLKRKERKKRGKSRIPSI